ncbi:GAF domain-like protein [Rhizoctonia solani]|uniref:GAF domain-like protein n=1 Tax=Rhizoctonia solani TaxID=456999 RepID=A0A8H7LWS9_9AGAM|nr:GAF domain-like protein [Rhizoctonia solani]
MDKVFIWPLSLSLTQARPVWTQTTPRSILRTPGMSVYSSSTRQGRLCDAFVNKSTVLVKDVEAYPGHIACDGGTRSEIVSPIFAADGRVVGVLDLDCLKEGAFEEVDREGVEKIAKLLGEGCDW